jgi:surface protein
MQDLFNGTAVANVDALANWNTKNVTRTDYMFSGASNLVDISGLATWNTSKVTNLMAMFSRTKIANVDALETKQHEGKDYVSWDVSNVQAISFMFSGATRLSDISALSSWNTSKVYQMDQFLSQTAISNIDALETKRHEGKNYTSWNVSGVKYMRWVFKGTTRLSDISALATWNTTGATMMDGLFADAKAITDVSAMANWSVSNVTSMDYMFEHVTTVADFSSLNDWTINPSNNKYRMFDGVPATAILPSWY